MKTELIRIHHAEYQQDIPFWTSLTENKDPILEVGCGHGRVTLPLLDAGHQIIGVDIDSLPIQYLHDSLEQKEPEIRDRALIFHEDIIGFQSDQRFGAVIIPCNTYSTFSRDKRRTMISKIYELLKPGGIFAASMPNPVQVMAVHKDLQESGDQYGPDQETFIIHPETGFPVQISSSLDPREDSLGWDWIYDHLYPDGKVERLRQSTEHYLTSLDTFLKEFNDVGFDKVKTFGDFDRIPFFDDSPYLILVGRK
jgi:SAM-dependent methyltransferase